MLYGGTGGASLPSTMPEILPDRLEAGTHNVAGIAGLLEGIRFVRKKGESTIFRHEQQLKNMAVNGLEKIPDIELFESSAPALQSGVISFRVRGRGCDEVSDYLTEKSVAVRTGLHCAPYAHRSAGTDQTGTVRLSFSAFNTRNEVAQVLALMQRKYQSP